MRGATLVVALAIAGCDLPPPIPEGAFDIKEQPRDPNGVDLPPAGILRMRYKGCMVCCHHDGRVCGLEDMPKASCLGLAPHGCAYMPVWGEPDDPLTHLRH